MMAYRFLILLAVFAVACSDPASPEDEPDDTPLTEVRALWVTHWDWSTPQEVAELMDNAAYAGFNLVYFQVRRAADALYRPGLEPWSERLGASGGDPGWDPLEVALQAAGAHGLEVHAWLNALIGWCGAQPPPASDPPHAILEHPEWLMVTEGGEHSADGCVWLTPGHPGVRTRLAAVAADVTRRYSVAGVHLDFVRYPNPNFSFDPASLTAYNEALAEEPDLNYAEFRRRLIGWMVKEVADSVRDARPTARLSAATWGIYDNPAGWSGVATGYHDRLQDSRAWGSSGWIDAVAPMVYWPIQGAYGSRLDFAYLADQHVAASGGAHVYIGITMEHVGFDETERQIERARGAGADGVAILSARLIRERGQWGAFREGPFRREAVMPVMAWQTSQRIAAAR